MKFDFNILHQKFKNYYKNYKEIYDKIEEKKRFLNIKPFLPKYNQCLHSVFAVDGSFINYWKSPLEKVYIGGVRIGFVKQTYQYDPKKDYIEECGSNDEFIFMNFSNSKSFPKSVLSFVMEKRERQKLYEFASNSKNQIIMVDGSLIEPFYMENRAQKEFIDILGEDKFQELTKNSTTKDLVDICKQNNHILVGVVKDSKEIKMDGIIRYEIILEKALQENSDSNNLYYFEVPNKDFKHIERTNDDFISIFAKLHKKSRKWHRIDILKSDHDLENEVLPSLANYSLYNRYLGTPRAPIICDEIAVEIRQRKKKVLQKIYQIMIDTGFNFFDAYFGSTDVNGKKESNIRTAHMLYDSNRMAKQFIIDE